MAHRKCVVVVGEELPAGLAANAAGVLSVALGHRVDGLVGADAEDAEDAEDADGVAHPGIIQVPLPILTAPREAVAAIVRAAAGVGDVMNDSFLSSSVMNDPFMTSRPANATLPGPRGSPVT